MLGGARTIWRKARDSEVRNRHAMMAKKKRANLARSLEKQRSIPKHPPHRRVSPQRCEESPLIFGGDSDGEVDVASEE